MKTAEVINMPEPFNGPKAPDVDVAIRKVADTVHRLNLQIHQAVDAGASIELMRVHRVHNGRGQWGDQMIPIVKLVERSKD
ncbi:hypothetical protein [Hyphomicrobium sp. ghe19]|uniref:hypothetical protein n=1 Tax=Hyphomicrobium sp. ghe19 TaxID=2682968 RepID=UPI001366C7A0|nr:hypothetical protein HYPP_01549 [Hyphomicrobium sp. ghe19]